MKIGLRFIYIFFSLSPCLLVSLSPCLPAGAADRTVAVNLGEPLEIAMPPSDSMTEWIAQDFPPSLLEQVAVRRLPAESVFVFRPLTGGIANIQFAKKVVGSVGAMSRTERLDVEVMITDRKSKPPKPGAPARDRTNKPWAAPADLVPLQTDSPPAFLSDPLVMDMLEGQLGFPAQNPPPPGVDTESALRRKYTLPFSYSYVIPEGSYLLNPTHQLPLPDTPSGIDSPPIPPLYLQALALAKRGLLKQAMDVLEEMLKEEQGKKYRNFRIEAFYQFVNAHLKMAAKEYADAIPRFKSLFTDRDYGLASRFYAALATENSGDTLGAISAYQGAISHNPEGFFTPEAAYRIARIFHNARAYDRARREYLDYVRTYPRTPFTDDSIMGLAHIHDHIYDFQDFDVALKLYESIETTYDESPYLETARARKKFILENYF